MARERAEPRRKSEEYQLRRRKGVARGGVCTAARHRSRISDPTPFNLSTSGIAAPRRDLSIRGHKAAVRGGTRRNNEEYKVARRKGDPWGGSCTSARQRNRISDKTPFSLRTGGIASPRRDLPIRRAEAWIAKGLPRVCSFLSADPPGGFNKDPTSPISGKKFRYG